MKIQHQKSVFFVDLNKNLCRGYTETWISRTQQENSVVYISHLLNIQKVTVQASESDQPFELVPQWKNSLETDENTAARNSTAKAAHGAAHDKPVDGECGRTGSGLAEPQLVCFELTIPDEFSSCDFMVRTVFDARPENPGFFWYRPVGSGDKHKELLAMGGSGCIFPYVDVEAPFELIYAIPNAEDTKVVSSGHAHSVKEEDRYIVHTYKAVTHPRHLMFCVGTYDQHDIFCDNNMRKIFLPVVENDPSDLIFDLQCIIKYIDGFCRADGLKSMSVLFTMVDVGCTGMLGYSPELGNIGERESVARSRPSGAGLVNKCNLCVFHCSQLYSPSDIETAYAFKRAACESLAYHVLGFYGFNLLDSWILHGFTGYLADCCYRSLLGHNEFLYNYKEDRDYVLEQDVVEPPLFYTERPEADYNSRFFRTKSKLVFHCLEAKLSTAFLQKITDEVLFRMNGTRCGVLGQGGVDAQVFTPQFMKIVRNQTGKDLSSFFDMYVFYPGLLRVKLTFQINPKKNMVRVNVVQSPTSMLRGCNKKYTGSIVLKMVEIEGTFEHNVTYDGENIFFYHTRTKKKKKEDGDEIMPLLFMRVDPKRECLFDFIIEQSDYMFMEQLLEKNVIGQVEAIEALGSKATAATCEAMERVMDNSHTFYRVRIRIIYALSSIRLDGYDGLQRLIQYFVRTRCVPNSTVLRGNEFGLVNYFIQKHLVRAIGMPIPRAAQEAASGLGGGLTSSKRKRSELVIAFLEHILKFNDNSTSQFDDSWYLAMAIDRLSANVLACCKDAGMADSSAMVLSMSDGHTVYSAPSGQTVTLLKSCLCEIERFRILDMVFASNNNIISRACLTSVIRLAAAGLAHVRRETLLDLVKYPTLYSMRLVAMEGLLLLYEDSIADILDSIRGDSGFFIIEVLLVIEKFLRVGMQVHRGQLMKYLEGLYEVQWDNRVMRGVIEEMMVFLAGRCVSVVEYRKHAVKQFNMVREKQNRSGMLEQICRNKTVRLCAFSELRISLLVADGIVRISPSSLRGGTSTGSGVGLVRALNIRLPCKVDKQGSRPAKSGTVTIRLKLPKKRMVHRRSDVPRLVIEKLLAHGYAQQVDGFIEKFEQNGHFDWEPKTLSRIRGEILEKTSQMGTGVSCYYLRGKSKEAGCHADWLIREIERSLVCVLNYNAMKSKAYSAAKGLFSVFERLVVQYAFVQPIVVPMSDELRECCVGFVNELLDGPEYQAFYNPVDCAVLKNYADVVRVPVCLQEIRGRVACYKSYDCFIHEIERVVRNCLNYNRSASDIAAQARALAERIDGFKEGIATASGRVEAGCDRAGGNEAHGPGAVRVALKGRDGDMKQEKQDIAQNGDDACGNDVLGDKSKVAALQCRRGVDVVRDIVASANEDGYFSDLLGILDDGCTWGDIENELNDAGRKYSKNASQAKRRAGLAKEIRRQLYLWFCLQDGRLLFVSD